MLIRVPINFRTITDTLHENRWSTVKEDVG